MYLESLSLPDVFSSNRNVLTATDSAIFYTMNLVNIIITVD